MARTLTVMRSPAVWFLGTLCLGALLAPQLAPYAADAVDLANRRAAPSITHWFGTDELGRDILTRVALGARVSLAIGLLAALVSAALGLLVGSIAGLVVGTRLRWVDDLLMRSTDALLALPRLPLLMIASAVLHPAVPMLILLVAGTGWMEAARTVRADVMGLASRDFVQAARATGVGDLRLWLRHLLPGVLPTASVATTLAVGRSILLESTMSFFGVGVQPPTPSWGNMLYQAQTTMSSEPWLALFPGLCIFATVLACNTMGDALGVAPSQRPR